MRKNRGNANCGIKEEFEASGLSVEKFADQLGVEPSWLRYWLELAEVRRFVAESQA